jgi:hypothetical protein
VAIEAVAAWVMLGKIALQFGFNVPAAARACRCGSLPLSTAGTSTREAQASITTSRSFFTNNQLNGFRDSAASVLSGVFYRSKYHLNNPGEETLKVLKPFRAWQDCLNFLRRHKQQ